MLVLLLGVALLFAPQVYAELATSTETMEDQGVEEIDGATPGLRKMGLGTRLRGILNRETETITTSGAHDLVAANRTILFESVLGNGISDASFENGYPGRMVTFILTADNDGTVDITPVTKSGFTSFTLSDVKDSITLLYQDDTVGWVVAGNNGATIN